MKRANTDNQPICYIPSTTSINLPSSTPSSCVPQMLLKRLKPHFPTKPPTNFIPSNQAEIISRDILQTLDIISPMNNDESYFKYIFFLGAQGKEFIASIQEQFPFNIPVLFITSNSFGCTNPQCQELMTYFGIKDPLGGGMYPLDYLLIVHDDKIHCKVPINFTGSNNRGNNLHGGIPGHLKFSVGLNELPSLIEEYIKYK